MGARASTRLEEKSARLKLIEVRYLGVDAQQLRDRRRIAPPEAALGGNGEVTDVLACRRESPPGSGDSVRIVHEAEAQLRPGRQGEPPQRREIGCIGAIARHRHMDEID